VPAIIDALEEMFYLSFANVAPMDKKLCFLIDCSGSMGSESLCEGVSNAEAAALLAMIFARGTNSNKHAFYLFSSGDENNGLFNVSDVIHENAKFEEVLNVVQRSDWASTDISKGILFAKQEKNAYDGFVVITDNDVNSGIKPSIALQEYRNEMQIEAKLAVIATQLSNYSIADPTDKGMLDICGFDSYSPKILHEFFSGVSEFEEVEE
jgi:60 kDa SS-A/Ro ribonucleoprotein